MIPRLHFLFNGFLSLLPESAGRFLTLWCSCVIFLKLCFLQGILLFTSEHFYLFFMVIFIFTAWESAWLQDFLRIHPVPVSG